MGNRVQGYLDKVNPTFDVTLPSGEVFKMRKITARDFIKEGGGALQSTKQIENNTDEQNKKVWNSLTEEQQLKQVEINDKIIVKAVVDPQLKTGKSSKEYLGVDDLSDADYYALLKEVTEVMSDKESLKSFCDKPTTSTVGHDGETVQSETVNPIK